MPNPLLQGGRNSTLLAQLTIGAAVTAQVTAPVTFRPGCKYLLAVAKFLYGAAGTTVKCWVQTSIDGGTTWIDIMNFAFTTSAATKVSAVTAFVALAAAVAPTDGTLADNTILNGLIGDQFRLKYTTTGTYTGATSLEVDITTKT